MRLISWAGQKFCQNRNMLRSVSTLGRRVASVKSSWTKQHMLTSPPTNVRMLSSKGSVDIRGVFPPLATPFTANEDVDYDKLQDNINKMNQHGFRGMVVHGSNGECAFLTMEERIKTLKKIREWTPSEKLVIAGTGLESTRHTIELTKAAADVGCNAVMVVTPCYYKSRMDTQALVAHYTKVADASPLPVILYSVPGNTSLDLSPDAIIPLAKHPNIIGLKDSGGDISKLANLVYRTQDEGFQIMAGSAGFFYPALSIGCVGGICGLANVLPGEVIELQKLQEAGKLDEARKLQHRLVKPNAGVTSMFGIAGMKTAMEWFGFNGGNLRSPLQPLADGHAETLRKIFVDSGFLK